MLRSIVGLFMPNKVDNSRLGFSHCAMEFGYFTRRLGNVITKAI